VSDGHTLHYHHPYNPCDAAEAASLVSDGQELSPTRPPDGRRYRQGLRIRTQAVRRRRQRWPVLLALLVAFGALAVAFVCLPYRSRVTRENCERIQKGMTEAEVRSILGKPWDDSLLDPEGRYPNEKTLVVYDLERESEQPYLGKWRSSYWMGDDAGVCVYFDHDGGVIGARGYVFGGSF
jgi:hypothetical protein